MVPLAQALTAAGHEVRWVTGPDASPRVESAGLEAVAAGPEASTVLAE
jgi:UDP:flavonoid glycosyltransferase YjiC (YdhE family)